MSILISPRLLCLRPIKISSSRTVTHLLPHPSPQSIPPAVNGISHSFTSAPRNKAAVSSFSLSANPTQVPVVPLPSMLPIRGNCPCASLACCSLNLGLLLCLFPSLGQPPAASRRGALSSSKSALPLCGATPELPVLSALLKSAYSQNPSSSMRLSMGLRKHEHCSFIAHLLWRS